MAGVTPTDPLVVIQSLYPDLYAILKNNPKLLSELEDYYRIKIGIEDGSIDSKENITLSPELIPYGGNLSITRMLTMHPIGAEDANFVELSEDEIRFYFTLSFRALAPMAIDETIHKNGNLEGNGDFLRIPVMGRISAGNPMPTPAMDFNYYDAETGVDIARSLLPTKKTDGLFALEAVGDAMIDAMVNDGDLVIMRKVNSITEVKNGEMVAAWLPAKEESTLKYFYREKNSYRLQPANPTVAPIIIDKSEGLEIRGKVVMVIRKVGGSAM